MRNFKRVLRKGISILLLTSTLVGTIPDGRVNEVRADSTDLRETCIQLMSGAQAVNVESIDQLSVNDLRCIALYLSNFYIPYATSLDNTEQQKKNEQLMVNALKSIGFQEDVAGTLVKAVYEASLSSAKPLYIREDQLYTGSTNWVLKGLFPVPEINTDVALGLTGTGFSLDGDSFFGIIYKSSEDNKAVPFQDKVVDNDTTYYPLSMFAYNALPERYNTRVAASFLGVNLWNSGGGKDGGRVPIELSWSDGGKMVPCFEINDFTCSFIKEFADAVDLSDGSGGMSILNTSIEDFNSLKETEQQALCTLTQRLYVDWVGNILCDFGDRRVIIYPACMNPYAFDAIGSKPVISSEAEPEQEDTEPEQEDTVPEEENTEDETLYVNGRRTAFSLISSWGLWFLNKSEQESASEDSSEAADSGIFSYTKGAEKTWDLKMYRGSGTSANWSDKNSTSGAQAVKERLDSWGYSTGEFKDGAWFGCTDGGKVAPELALYSFDFSVDKADILSDVLIYKSIANNQIKELDNGSVFTSFDIFDAAHDYFTQSNKFTVKSNDFSGYMQFTDSDYAILKNIFLTYVFAYDNRSATSFDRNRHYIDMKFCADNFPASMDTNIVWENLDTSNEEITSFIYYLLHPRKGVNYVTTLVKNKFSGILVGFHEDIVGGTESNSTTGMTKYLGFTGYVTSPSLREIDWVDSLLSAYNNIVIYLIIAMCVVICCYLITGQMRPGRAILGVMFFGIMAYIPPVALNFSADKVNLFCDTVYSNKFDYWAYTQLETHLHKLRGVQTATSETDYIDQLLDVQTDKEKEAKIGFSGVKLKWMTPKKIYTGDEVSDELDNALSDSFSSLFVSVISNSLTSMNRGEEYVDSVNATYLYRDICDIYMHAACGYNLYNSFNSENKANPIGEGTENGWDPTDSYLIGQLRYSSGEYLGDYVMPNFKPYRGTDTDIYNVTSSGAAASLGFLHDNAIDADSSAKYNYTSGTYVPSDEAYVNQDSGRALGFPFGYVNVYEKVHKNYESLLWFLGEGDDYDESEKEEIELNLNTIENLIFGLSPKTFNFGLQDLQRYSNLGRVSSDNLNSGDEPKYTEMSYETLSGYYYALYAESPFYFFNNHFRDYVVSHHPEYTFTYPVAAHKTNLYKLLVRNKQDFFYNYATTAGAGYGELRDFMGMHDLFYYVMPMLAEGNKVADLFDENFGMYVNEDVPLQILKDGRISYDGEVFETFEDLINLLKSGELDSFEELNPEQIYKLWHDYNVWTIFQSYVPWLDTMEDCKYAKPETLQIAGKKFEVTNPLDPTCYYSVDDSGTITEGRLMVFSRSEMKYYGLGMGDLTTVERKIIEVQDNVYKNALDLMNYYTLSDEVLINAFSMLQVFEFNKAFSQDSVLGQSYIMYPQGYEAKAFTYDAYLRLVVAEASGEPLQVNQNNNTDTSIYRRIMKNTSVFFGVVLLVNDIMAVYIIPVMKVAILLVLFFTSVLLITGAAIRIEFNPIQTIWKCLLAPLGSYVLINTGFAWVVSLFMSNGAEGVVETSKTITIGDPTTVLLIMIFIHAVVMILLFKICRKCFKDFKTFLISVADSITATVIGAAAVLGATLTGTRRLKTRRTENGQPSGIPSSAAQRGIQNTSILGGAAGMAMVGNALGANMGAMSADAREAAQRADNRYAAKKGLNKYDAKAYDKAAAREDKLKNKYDSLNKKHDQAVHRGNERAAAKYEARANQLQKKWRSAAKYSQNISDGGRLYAYNNKAKDTTKEVFNRVSGMARHAATTMHDIPGNVGYAVGRAEAGVDNFATAMGSTLRNAPGEIRSAAGDIYSAVGRAPSVVKGAVLRGASAAESYKDMALGTAVQAKRAAWKSLAQAKRNYGTGYAFGRGNSYSS